MESLKDYLSKTQSTEQKERMEEVFGWISVKFPNLEAVIKWNQPMFIWHSTFIIGFRIAKNHMSFSPEEACINIFSKDISEAGYEHTKGLVKIKWTDTVDYNLLHRLIEFNISDKKECNTFFRK